MPNVVFAVPYVMDNTLRFVRAALSLPDVRLSILSQDPPEKLPPDIRRAIAAHERVKDGMSADDLAAGCERLAKKSGRIEALLSILEPLQVALGQVRERLRIRGMDSATAHNFRDKAHMKELFRAHDLPCARHALCATVDEAVQFGRKSGYPMVVKPPAGAGAKATARVDDEAQLTSFLRSSPPSPRAPMLLEEFVKGREFSFDTVTLHGQHVLHNISDYHPTPLTVIENPWIQWAVVLPRDISGPEYEPIHKAGARAVSTLGMWTGITHMEWFRRDDGTIAISEVAARPPGAQFMSLMSQAYDTDMYRAWARLMVFERFDVPERKFAAGAAYLRGQGEGRVAHVHGMDKLGSELTGLIVEAKMPEPGQPHASSYEGEGHIIVRHPDTKVVESALDRIVSTLRVEMQ